MGKEEIFSITDVLIAANNFKTSADRRSWQTRFGESMFGRDRRLKISWGDTTRVKIG
jgi:hypothetical protein